MDGSLNVNYLYFSTLKESKEFYYYYYYVTLLSTLCQFGAHELQWINPNIGKYTVVSLCDDCLALLSFKE